ncbi:TlpA family protein disulfide reductase [Seonamhaeicola aphaedonensis]|uniref:Peroxiredoxin n=1 Tax=Seonamhaeicola aphaedonensis TaxID=1461338 RepID=A0A3D9HFP8_9FLAO|nr:TlpA family protein disulfide reductase [Seonamhaeicola aphaedonensis]RED48308.1 peroxiredoxin [Seonamhaeicola aphaedonensis]
MKSSVIRIVLLVVTFLVFSCFNKKNAKVLDNAEQKTELEIYDFERLEPILYKEDNTIYVINFWATWCAPCVKELPYFEDLYANYKDKNVEVILVSLDFPHQYESKLKPFIKERDLKSKIVVLDDVDSNSWIPKVNKDWSGSIPATIIYKDNKRQFYEQSFTYNELEEVLKEFLN